MTYRMAAELELAGELVVVNAVTPGMVNSRLGRCVCRVCVLCVLCVWCVGALCCAVLCCVLCAVRCVPVCP